MKVYYIFTLIISDVFSENAITSGIFYKRQNIIMVSVICCKFWYICFFPSVHERGVTDHIGGKTLIPHVIQHLLRLF
ncbi:hypothetical protein CC662_26300, partial [Salmonella enterica subsp. enterica]|nr:hypothetical protein [Salmonella enterica subsp. enterica]